MYNLHVHVGLMHIHVHVHVHVQSTCTCRFHAYTCTRTCTIYMYMYTFIFLIVCTRDTTCKDTERIGTRDCHGNSLNFKIFTNILKGVWKLWAGYRTFWPIFITLVLLPIYFVYSSVSIYRTFTRFIGQYPAWLAVSTPLLIIHSFLFLFCLFITYKLFLCLSSAPFKIYHI